MSPLNKSRQIVADLLRKSRDLAKGDVIDAKSRFAQNEPVAEDDPTNEAPKPRPSSFSSPNNSDDDFGDRIQRIRASLEKINNLTAELRGEKPPGPLAPPKTVENDRGEEFTEDGIHMGTGTEYDHDGFNSGGYDEHGFDLDNKHQNGTYFDDEGYDLEGYDVSGTHMTNVPSLVSPEDEAMAEREGDAFYSDPTQDTEPRPRPDLKVVKLEKGQNGFWDKEGYTLQHHDDAEGDHVITAHDKTGAQVGVAIFNEYDGLLESDHTEVHEDHQRKGLATAMYNMAESESGMSTAPAENSQSEEVKALWNQPNRPFGD